MRSGAVDGRELKPPYEMDELVGRHQSDYINSWPWTGAFNVKVEIILLG